MKEKFFFPQEGKTIEADTLDEALKLLNSNTKENVSSDKKHISKKK